MKLRDHPLMVRKSGWKTWPPRWWSPSAPAQIRAEMGILEEVRKNDAIENKLYLTIRHQGSVYLGVLQFDDIVFCGQVLQLLEAQIGRSVREIGDMDVSHLL